MQRGLLKFVKRLETLLDSTEIPDIEAEGIRDVESWLESVAASGASLIYRNEIAESATIQSAQPTLEQPAPTGQPASEGTTTYSSPSEPPCWKSCPVAKMKDMRYRRGFVGLQDDT